jgi:hypothetical protein
MAKGKTVSINSDYNEAAAKAASDEPGTYLVPQPIAFALETDRAELCDIFAAQIAPENPMAAALATVLGGLLTDRRNVQNTLIHLQDVIEQNADQFDALRNRTEVALKHARGEATPEEQDWLSGKGKITPKEKL